MPANLPVINIFKAFLVLGGMAFASLYLLYRQEPNRLHLINRLKSRNSEQTKVAEVNMKHLPEERDFSGDLRAAANLKTTAEPDWSLIYRGGPAQRSKLAAAIKEASNTYSIDQNLIRSVIMAESMFDPQAVSEKGAKGLMQLMPETARQLGVKDPFNLRQNVLAGTLYLSLMLKEFKGNLSLALAAYHSGPQSVIDKGNQVPYESKHYVLMVASYYQLFGVDSEMYSDGVYKISR